MEHLPFDIPRKRFNIISVNVWKKGKCFADILKDWSFCSKIRCSAIGWSRFGSFVLRKFQSRGPSPTNDWVDEWKKHPGDGERQATNHWMSADSAHISMDLWRFSWGRWQCDDHKQVDFVSNLVTVAKLILWKNVQDHYHLRTSLEMPSSIRLELYLLHFFRSSVSKFLTSYSYTYLPSPYSNILSVTKHFCI